MAFKPLEINVQVSSTIKCGFYILHIYFKFMEGTKPIPRSCLLISVKPRNQSAGDLVSEADVYRFPNLNC